MAGNVNYGYVGRELGFSTFELRLFAGVAQVWDHVGRPILNRQTPEWNLIGPPSTFFDQPRDQAAIMVGVMIHDRKTLTVNVHDLYAGTEQYRDMLNHRTE